jgi:hypothetical protein
MLIPNKHEGYSRDGRRLYYFGDDSGGGGGAAAAAPSDKQTQIAELPEWARGYAKNVLAKGAALTDINQNPYQTYGANRIAGFSPMQQRAQQGAANMRTSGQLGTATDLASAAGMGALGTYYKPGEFSAGAGFTPGKFSGGLFGQGAADYYMNPYQQNVTDIGKREAARQSNILGTQQAGQATQAGAFGGSRDAIMQAERERNLGQQMGDIQAQGSNAAFQQAQQQFNADQARRMQAKQMGEQSRQYGAGLLMQDQQLGEQSRQYGAGLGMQGLQTGLQAAGQLGQLGQTQYGQQMGINQLQNQYGGQQQQQTQRYLDQDYQDFQNQQNYPYKQLGYMSDMINRMPLGQQSTSSMYSQGPGTVQTLAGLGGAAYGFGKSGLFGGKEGGLMTSYAKGGGVTSQANKDSIIEDMYSMEGLQKAKEAALARRDIDTVEAIDERIAQLNAIQAQSASLDRGLGSAYDQIPSDRQEEMMYGANGGIVAFAGGGTYGKRFEQSLTDLKAMANKAPVEPTPEQRDEAISTRIPMLEKRYGPDITQPYLEETKAKRAKLPEQMEKDQGLAIAMASLGLLARSKKPGESQKQQLLSGLGEAGQSFIGEVGKLKKENREVDDKLRQSEILLATAQQSRKEGLINKADAEETRAQDLKRDAFKTNLGVQEKIAQLDSGLAGTEMQGENALKVAGVSAASHLAAAKITAAKETDLHRQTNIRYASLIEQGKPANKQTMAEAAAMAASDVGKYSGVDRAADARAAFYDKISDNVDASLLMDKKYRELQKEDKKTNGTAAQQYREQRIAVEIDKARSQSQPTQGQPAPNAPAQQQQAAPVAKPSLNEFLNEARKANQGVSDADLTTYYNNKYGK